jgi:hypothetical protein
MLWKDILIDPEFEARLRPQSDEERDDMRRSIDEHGYLSPLIVWEGHKLLVDGHHRLQDYKRRLAAFEAAQPTGLLGRLKRGTPPTPPDIVQVKFEDRNAVLYFIEQQQLGKRNLNEAEISLHRAAMAALAKKRLGTQAAACQAVAEQTGVSPRQVRRDIEFAAAVEKVAPIVHRVNGVDLKSLVTDAQIAPAKSSVTEAAALLDAARCAPGGLSSDVERAVAETATRPHNMRIDAPETPKPPAWEAKLVSFEQAVERALAEAAHDADTRRAIRKRVNQMLTRYFPQKAAAIAS